MARRHGRNGKNVTGTEIGFIAGQGVAIMMLLGILMVYGTAWLNFKLGYADAVTVEGDWAGVAIIFVISQGFAIFFAIKTRKKKRELSQKSRDYEESIRQDMQNNQEVHQLLENSIDQNRLFTELEPLRKRIYKNQRAIEKIKEIPSSSISGLIGRMRQKRIQNQLDMDNTHFYKEYKKNIAEPILNQMFEETQYKPSQGFTRKGLEEFKLISERYLSVVKSEDYIEGVYKGIRYRQADVKMEKSAKNSELLNQMKGIQGRISEYDFTKPIQGEIIIKTKQINAYIGYLEKVVMENLQFNEKFEVYASDAHMVFYVLTPQFMEYLLQLKLWGETVFRFVNDKIFVFRNQVAGMFEPDMGRPLDIAYEVGKSYNELKEIIDFIDVLNLEQEETATDTVFFGGFQGSTNQPAKEEETIETADSTGGQIPVAEETQEQSTSKFRLKLE